MEIAKYEYEIKHDTELRFLLLGKKSVNSTTKNKSSSINNVKIAAVQQQYTNSKEQKMSSCTVHSQLAI